MAATVSLSRRSHDRQGRAGFKGGTVASPADDSAPDLPDYAPIHGPARHA
jgi:hypothetical protein